MPLHLSQDPDADALLDADPLALLLGMALDQDVREGCTAQWCHAHALALGSDG